jgi:hypothetical protein
VVVDRLPSRYFSHPGLNFGLTKRFLRGIFPFETLTPWNLTAPLKKWAKCAGVTSWVLVAFPPRYFSHPGLNFGLTKRFLRGIFPFETLTPWNLTTPLKKWAKLAGVTSWVLVAFPSRYLSVREPRAFGASPPPLKKWAKLAGFMLLVGDRLSSRYLEIRKCNVLEPDDRPLTTDN